MSHPEPFPHVREAMRLIRSGDLRAATDVLQRGLNGSAAVPATQAGAAAPLEGAFRLVEEGARFTEHTYAGVAGSRRYKLFIPASLGSAPAPLVLMLHGCTQTPDDFAAGTRMNEHAERHGFVVAYPAQAQGANAARCWNWFKGGDQQRDRGEPAILAGLVQELLATHGLDRRRVYVAGLSAGGAMAAILAQTHPDLFAAAAVHSGLPHGAAHDVASAHAAMRGNGRASDRAAPGSETPMIVFHGDRDTTVDCCNGAGVARQAAGADPGVATANAGAPGGHATTVRTFQDERGRTLVEYWLVHGAGHAWAGGDPAGSHTDPRGPDASREIVRFFLERLHCGA